MTAGVPALPSAVILVTVVVQRLAAILAVKKNEWRMVVMLMIEVG